MTEYKVTKRKLSEYQPDSANANSGTVRGLAPTQHQGGGMTEIYQETGTYLKSFYPVMNAPSCVRISVMGETVRRIHHTVDWSTAVPVIISEDHRKVS